jgi:hypothetical protein
MYPPVYETLKSAPAVTAFLGTNPTRVFLTEAPQKGNHPPYLVWNTANGTPENYLGSNSDIDQFSTPMDIYATTYDEARQIVKAVRNALDGKAYITAWLGETIDFETKLKVVSFDVDWFTARNVN